MAHDNSHDSGENKSHRSLFIEYAAPGIKKRGSTGLAWLGLTIGLFGSPVLLIGYLTVSGYFNIDTEAPFHQKLASFTLTGTPFSVAILLWLVVLYTNRPGRWIALAGVIFAIPCFAWVLNKAVTVGFYRMPPGSW